MKISELVTELNVMRAKYGDLDIRCFEKRWQVPYALCIKRMNYNDVVKALEIEMVGLLEKKFGKIK